ncbi:MAG TPA: hypothetical protein VEK80_06520, partial [Kribbellaceae bacterium]|nr:hypothetical protein [Kribbellaceae bacterium]
MRSPVRVHPPVHVVPVDRQRVVLPPGLRRARDQASYDVRHGHLGSVAADLARRHVLHQRQVEQLAQPVGRRPGRHDVPTEVRALQPHRRVRDHRGARVDHGGAAGCQHPDPVRRLRRAQFERAEPGPEPDQARG